MKRSGKCAFSLVEVVLALGVISFAVLALLVLLSVGVQTNYTSAQETRAACILTTLEADLRNTYPTANGGKSKYFGLLLPYTLDALGHVAVNPAVSTNTVYTTGLTENELPTSIVAVPRSPYQASIIYTSLPAAGLHAPIEARLIVSWPSRNTADPVALTSVSNTSEFVESYVSFPVP